MTLTVDSRLHSNPIQVESDTAWDEVSVRMTSELEGDEQAKCEQYPALIQRRKMPGFARRAGDRDVGNRGSVRLRGCVG